MPEPTSRPEIDFSDGPPPSGRVLEAAFCEAVTEMALLIPERSFLRGEPGHESASRPHRVRPDRASGGSRRPPRRPPLGAGGARRRPVGRAAGLPDPGLAAGLRSPAATTLESQTGLSIRLVGDSGARFAVRVIGFYRIVEKALTNVMRHAAARSVTISHSHDNRRLTVTVEDAGAGFDASHRVRPFASGMGLLCMEERARLVDGSVEFDSEAR